MHNRLKWTILILKRKEKTRVMKRAMVEERISHFQRSKTMMRRTAIGSQEQGLEMTIFNENIFVCI